MKEITKEEGKILVQDDRWRIMEILHLQGPMYAKKIANELKMTEQNIHYHLNELKKGDFISLIPSKEKKRGQPKLLIASENRFFLQIIKKETKKAQSFFDAYIRPNFYHGNNFDGKIIVGSAEPHGIFNAIARDGYMVGYFCWYLGQNWQHDSEFSNRIITDIECKFDLLKDSNLVLIGGHITNTVTAEFNNLMKERFNVYFRENTIISRKNQYNRPEHGLVGLFPMRAIFPKSSKWVLLFAGVRAYGTKSAIFSVTNELLSGKNLPKTGFITILKGSLTKEHLLNEVKILEIIEV